MKILNADLEIQKARERLSLHQECLQTQIAKRDAATSEKKKAAYQHVIQKTEQAIQSDTLLLDTLETAAPYLSFQKDTRRMKKIFDAMNEVLKSLDSVKNQEQTQRLQDLLCDGYEILSTYLPNQDYQEKQNQLYAELLRRIQEEYHEFIQSLLKTPECVVQSRKQKEIAQKYDIVEYFSNSLPYLYPCPCLETILRKMNILDSLRKTYTDMQNDKEDSGSSLSIPEFLNSLPHHPELLF